MTIIVAEEHQDISAELIPRGSEICFRVSGLEKAAAMAQAFRADLLVVPTNSPSLYAVLSRLTEVVPSSRVLIINPSLPYCLYAEKESGSSFHARIPGAVEVEKKERKSA